MRAFFLVALVLGAFAGNAAASKPEFVIGFLPKVNLSDYEVASLSDIKSDAFVQQYNSVGISYVQQVPGAPCCTLSVREGLLAYGSVGQNGFVEAFQGTTDMCTTGLVPQNTTFGVPYFGVGPYAGTLIPQLNRTALNQLHINNSIPSAYGFACLNSKAYQFTAIFKLIQTAPEYVIQPFGPNFPAPVGYRQGSLSDFVGASFVTSYNTNGVYLSGTDSQTNFCCMIQVSDGGWLTYGAENNFSPLTLYLRNTYTWSCGSSSNNQYHTLGTFFGGAQNNVLLWTLNATNLPLIGYFNNNTQSDFDGCDQLPDSLTFYVRE